MLKDITKKTLTEDWLKNNQNGSIIDISTTDAIHTENNYSISQSTCDIGIKSTASSL